MNSTDRMTVFISTVIALCLVVLALLFYSHYREHELHAHELRMRAIENCKLTPAQAEATIP